MNDTLGNLDGFILAAPTCLETFFSLLESLDSCDGNRLLPGKHVRSWGSFPITENTFASKGNSWVCQSAEPPVATLPEAGSSISRPALVYRRHPLREYANGPSPFLGVEVMLDRFDGPIRNKTLTGASQHG